MQRSLPPVVSAATPLPTPGQPPQVTEASSPNSILAAATPEGQKFVLHQFHRSETKDGKKLWEVTADRGEYIPENNTAILSNAILEMSREKEGVLEIRADDATLFLSGTALAKAELRGNVVVIKDKKTTLKTETATFNRMDDSIVAPGPVTIVAPLLDISGIGLNGDLKTEKFSLASRVATTIKPRMDGSP